MKTSTSIFTLISAGLLLIFTAQPAKSQIAAGFPDVDGNGVNDLFCDVNGDGINDVDGKAYPHDFEYYDLNGDGKNDTFQDADGDGVNDLISRPPDSELESRPFIRVIDVDRNWVNDITGEVYNRREYGGDRFGFILEESQLRLSADEMKNRSSLTGPVRAKGPARDCFIDRDGDGVSDGRSFNRHRKMRGGMMHNKP